MHARFSRSSAAAAIAALLLAVAPAFAATFTVDTTADLVDAAPGDHQCATAAKSCSLRAAVQEANATAGLDEILLPAGTFTLTLAGAGEDAGATGDLDVSGDLTLTGAAQTATVIDGGALDRVFDHHPAPGGTTLWLVGMTVRNGVVTGASNGGCFRNPENGQLLFDRVTASGCLAARMGGAVYNAGRFEAVASAILDSGDPEQNHGIGGGVANVGPAATVFLLHSELRGNRAENGGALYTSAEFIQPNTSEVRLEHCSLVGNSARQNGAAVLNNSRTRVFLEDSTVSGNTAGSGGGLSNDGGGFFFVRNSTITQNHATNIGGGISEVHFNDDFIVLRNSILAGNTADFLGPDCNFRITSEGGTLLGNTANCEMAAGPGDQLNVDPKLGTLVRLGPSTWAHLPQPSSPVIDAGSNALCTKEDQRGNPRPLDGDGNGQAICDIGAIELGGDLFVSGFETGDTSEWSLALP